LLLSAQVDFIEFEARGCATSRGCVNRCLQEVIELEGHVRV
jgi:hypothetical protein